AFFLCEEFLFLRLDTTFRINNQTGVKKQVGNAHRLRKKSAGIISQIENEAFEPAFLRSQLLQRLLHVAVAALLKLSEPNISITLVDRKSVATGKREAH